MARIYGGLFGRRRARVVPGTPPGTLAAHPEAVAPLIHAFAYGPERVEETDVGDDLAELRRLKDELPVLWVNVDGLGSAETIRALGERFGLHALALEDVLATNQRPKVEVYDTFLYVVLRVATLGEGLETEQISIFLGDGFVLTFQERTGDGFDPVRRRIRSQASRLRSRGPGYLAYALIDAMVDGYFPFLETYGERLEALEDEVLARPAPPTVMQIHRVRRELLTLRRVTWPLREALARLAREELEWIDDETRVYLRDGLDHTLRVIDIVETYREVAASLVELYLSSVSNHMNEIMKVLTMIATIFIPLGFVAGLYGMNFDTKASPWSMPELGWRFGYPLCLILMATITGSLLWYFRKKGWLASPLPEELPGGDASDTEIARYVS